MKRFVFLSLLLASLSSERSLAEETEAPTKAAEFVRFAAGKFRVGLLDRELVALGILCQEEEEPAACPPERFSSELASDSDVTVAPFSLMRREVSVGEYRRCEALGHCAARTDGDSDETLPVTFVEYRDAATYCEFVGARLPTETEFEFAARGKARRLFAPKGTFARGLVNAGQPGPLGTDGRDGFVERAPVLSFSRGATPEGMLHLSGNVEEWTQTKGSAAPGEPPDEGTRIVRGGHFASPLLDVRGTARHSSPEREKTKTRGFRCAR